MTSTSAVPGALQDNGERLKLQRPDSSDTNNASYITVDEVRYNDKAPWPVAADGFGYALQRKNSAAYGNDPINWTVGAPTPGRPNDDRDGLPDEWELVNGTNPDVADATDDPDHDGLTNMQEYLAGTDPQKPESVLAFERITFSQPSLAMEFTARSNHTYRLLVGNTLDSGWSPLLIFPAHQTNRMESVTVGTTNQSRFYRLATP